MEYEEEIQNKLNVNCVQMKRYIADECVVLVRTPIRLTI